MLLIRFVITILTSSFDEGIEFNWKQMEGEKLYYNYYYYNSLIQHFNQNSLIIS